MQSELGAVKLNYQPNIQQRQIANPFRSGFIPECNTSARHSNPDLRVYQPEGATGGTFVEESNRIDSNFKFGQDESLDLSQAAWNMESQPSRDSQSIFIVPSTTHTDRHRISPVQSLKTPPSTTKLSPEQITTVPKQPNPPPLPPKPPKPNRSSQMIPDKLSQSIIQSERGRSNNYSINTL